MTKSDNIKMFLAVAGLILSALWLVLVMASEGLNSATLFIVLVTWSLCSLQHRLCNNVSTSRDA